MHPSAPRDSAAEQAQPDVAACEIEMSWTKATTPLEAIERALYALADQASGVTSEVDQRWTVLICPRSATADPDALRHRFRQEVTDQTLRLRIAERTDPIRNLVFALAFSKSGLAREPSISEVEHP